MLRILKTLAIVVISFVLMLFLYPWILRGLGYYVDNTGSEIGRLAAEKKDVSLCNKIIVYSHVLGPPTMSRRGECIYVYAEQTKDPSVCELLMPSSYVLDCVGAAENHHLPCETEAYSVYWKDGDAQQISHLKECLQPNSKRSLLGNQCCQVAKVRYLLQENDCSSLLSNLPAFDRCLYNLAWKLKDPNYCTDITNLNAKFACQAQSKALQKNPSICSGCTPPVNSIEDLR